MQTPPYAPLGRFATEADVATEETAQLYDQCAELAPARAGEFKRRARACRAAHEQGMKGYNAHIEAGYSEYDARLCGRISARISYYLEMNS